LAGFDAAVAAALGRSDDPPSWADARATLEQYLDRGELDLLEHFRRQLVEPGAATLFEWADVLRVLELAQRWVEGLPEPVARKVEWRSLSAFADATRVFGDPLAKRFKTFGQRPVAHEDQPPPLELGWALRSPALALAQGTRTLTLTLGFEPHSFDRSGFVGGLGIDPVELDEARLRAALALALIVEVSTEKGWVELPIDRARLAG